LAESDPYGFLKFSRSIIPPELIRNVFNRPDVPYEELTNDEVMELLEAGAPASIGVSVQSFSSSCL
jgi:hypothetical protein